MKNNKISILFLVSMLAIAGIGISYAGFSDNINVYGTVDTATVQLTLEDYSGTVVWKIWDCPTTTPPVYPGLTLDIANEVAIYRGFNLTASYYAIEELFSQWGCSYEKEASAAALPGNVGDVDCDVLMRWMNLFPCINFTADVIIHYTGTIPAHVTVGDIVWATGLTQNDTILSDLGAYTQFKAYNYTKDSAGVWRKGLENTFPVQMHYCQYVGIEVTIHLPQNNTLQGLYGQFNFNINAVQWNDLCDKQPIDLPPVVKITNYVNNSGQWLIQAIATDDYGIVLSAWTWSAPGWPSGTIFTYYSPLYPTVLFINRTETFDPKFGVQNYTCWVEDTAGQRGGDMFQYIPGT